VTETPVPLNVEGFSDEALIEGDAWLFDAVQAVKSLLAVKIRAGLIGGSAPDPHFCDIDGAVRTLLSALSGGTLIAFARHPQTGARSPVEAVRWKSFAAPLVVEHRSVPSHLSEEFGAFVNRRLRVDGTAFLDWFWVECRRRRSLQPRIVLQGFEHLAAAERMQQQKARRVAKDLNSFTVPEGYVSISRLHDDGFRLLFPEAHDRPWLRNQPQRSIAQDPPTPPPELLEAWGNRLSRPLRGPPVARTVDAREWEKRLSLDVARRLLSASNATNTKVLFWSKEGNIAFEAPERLLDPNLTFLKNGTPWLTGRVDTLFIEGGFASFEGAALFVTKTDRTKIWAAFVEGALISFPEAKASASAEGKKRGRTPKATDRAKQAAIALWGKAKRPEDLTQDAAFQAMNDWLAKDDKKLKVSMTTALRALGERD
jgi:hypothetical protein